MKNNSQNTQLLKLNTFQLKNVIIFLLETSSKYFLYELSNQNFILSNSDPNIIRTLSLNTVFFFLSLFFP